MYILISRSENVTGNCKVPSVQELVTHFI